MEEAEKKQKKGKTRHKVLIVITSLLIIMFIRYMCGMHPYKFEGRQYVEDGNVVIELRGEKYYYISEELKANKDTGEQICELKSSTVNDLNKIQLLITAFPIYKIKYDENDDFILFTMMIGKYKGIYGKKEVLEKVKNWKDGEVTGLRIKCYNGRMEITKDKDKIEFFKKLKNYKDEEVIIPIDNENQDLSKISFYYNDLPFFQQEYRLIKYKGKYYYFVSYNAYNDESDTYEEQFCMEIKDPEMIEGIKGLFEGEYNEYLF